MALVGFKALTIVVLLALVFFGPKKLPEIPRSFGEAKREWEKTMRKEGDE